MLLTLSTASVYHLPLRAAFRLAAETGFDGLELAMGPQVWLRGARHVAALCAEYGLEVYSVHQTLMRGSPQGGGPRRVIDAANMALELGCPCVVIHGTWALRWAEARAQRWLRTVEQCRERLRGSGTRLALENPGVYSEIDRHAVLGPFPVLIDFARRHDLDITFDTCHAGSAGLELLDAYDQIGDRLVNVHLSDLRPGGLASNVPVLRILLAHHQMPGEGCLPLGEFLSHLAAHGFAKPVALEVSPIALRAWSLRQLRRRLSQGVDYVRSAVRRPRKALKNPAPIRHHHNMWVIWL